jgi:COMPASS component SWD3
LNHTDLYQESILDHHRTMTTPSSKSLGKKRPLASEQKPLEEEEEDRKRQQQPVGPNQPSDTTLVAGVLQQHETTRNKINNNSINNNSINNNINNPNHYQLLPSFGEHKRAVSSVKFAPSRLTKNRDGAALVASASADGTVKIWDLKQEHALVGLDSNNNNQNSNTSKRSMNAYATCLGHSRGINEVCWNPISPLLATASDDKTVRVWDAVTSEALVELRGHNSFVFAVDQHNSLIVTGSFDETVKLWDIRSGDCFSTLPAHSDPVTAVSFNRDGTCVCSASHDGLIRIWDVATGECLKTIYAAGNPPVSACKYAPNGKYLLAGTLDSALRLWPVTQTGRHSCAKTYYRQQQQLQRNDDSVGEHYRGSSNHKYSIVADFTGDGQSIVTGSETGQVVLFDLQTRRVQQVLHGHEDAVLAVSAHDRLPLICSGAMTEDRRVLLWAKPELVDEMKGLTLSSKSC